MQYPIVLLNKSASKQNVAIINVVVNRVLWALSVIGLVYIF